MEAFSGISFPGCYAVASPLNERQSINVRLQTDLAFEPSFNVALNQRPSPIVPLVNPLPRKRKSEKPLLDRLVFPCALDAMSPMWSKRKVSQLDQGGRRKEGLNQMLIDYPLGLCGMNLWTLNLCPSCATEDRLDGSSLVRREPLSLLMPIEWL